MIVGANHISRLDALEDYNTTLRTEYYSEYVFLHGSGLTSPSLQDFGLAGAYCGAPNPTLRLSTASAAIHVLPVIVAAFPLSSIGPMHATAIPVSSAAIITNNKIMQKRIWCPVGSSTLPASGSCPRT
ncbi:hypothetical protein BDV09DRAFT_155021 [Aspergillus tetrazonus]